MSDHELFTHGLWQRTASIRTAIDALPFLTELRDGTLAADRFQYYLCQDAAYLVIYGQALAAAASQSPDPDDVVFWAESARSAVAVERAMHTAHGADLRGEMSPTCTAYTSYLAALGARGEYAVLAAGLLPCAWVYHDVGTRLAASIPDLAAHPYRAWIATYDDPDFAATTDQAKGVVDRLAATATAATRARMAEAFITATRYEWMFWDAAYRMETWPV